MTPEESIALRKKANCLRRHIKTLRHTILNDETKLMHLEAQLYEECPHEYQVSDVTCTVGSVEVIRYDCVYCGEENWRIVK